MKGVEELRFICETVTQLGLSTAVFRLDATLGQEVKLLHRSYFFSGATQTVPWDPSVAEDVMMI
jgi:histidyl-tRNA synthetase